MRPTKGRIVHYHHGLAPPPVDVLPAIVVNVAEFRPVPGDGDPATTFRVDLVVFEAEPGAPAGVAQSVRWTGDTPTPGCAFWPPREP